jgi:hypothetical protein
MLSSPAVSVAVTDAMFSSVHSPGNVNTTTGSTVVVGVVVVVSVVVVVGLVGVVVAVVVGVKVAVVAAPSHMKLGSWRSNSSHAQPSVVLAPLYLSHTPVFVVSKQ